MKHKKLLIAVLVLVLVGLAVLFSLPSIVDKRMNTLALAPPYTASEKAKALHEKLFIADLHDDALLWSRDLLHRYDYGHTDLPRLLEGRVSLQVFSTVTKTPKGLNFERNSDDTDSITMLAMAQRWPQRTWGSLLERALYQGEKLHAAAKESEGAMRVVRSQADLAEAFAGPAPRADGWPPFWPRKACIRWRASWRTWTNFMTPVFASLASPTSLTTNWAAPPTAWKKVA